MACPGCLAGDLVVAMGLVGPWVRRMRLVAALLRAAMTCGPPAVRGWWRSSSRVASWIRWRRFSVPRCPWTQVSHRPGVGLSGGRGAGQVDDPAGALLTGRAGSGAPGGGAGAPDLEDLGGCGEVGPGRGGGLGAHGVGGDHGPVQARGSTGSGRAGISLDLSATLRWVRTVPVAWSRAASRCGAAWSPLRAPRTVLPSTAMSLRPWTARGSLNALHRHQEPRRTRASTPKPPHPQKLRRPPAGKARAGRTTAPGCPSCPGAPRARWVRRRPRRFPPGRSPQARGDRRESARLRESPRRSCLQRSW